MVKLQAAKKFVRFEIEALDDNVLDRAARLLDLAFGPGIPGLGNLVIDVILCAGVFKSARAEVFAVAMASLINGTADPPPPDIMSGTP